jgi:hypothetical protein
MLHLPVLTVTAGLQRVNNAVGNPDFIAFNDRLVSDESSG